MKALLLAAGLAITQSSTTATAPELIFWGSGVVEVKECSGRMHEIGTMKNPRRFYVSPGAMLKALKWNASATTWDRVRVREVLEWTSRPEPKPLLAPANCAVS